MLVAVAESAGPRVEYAVTVRVYEPFGVVGLIEFQLNENGHDVPEVHTIVVFGNDEDPLGPDMAIVNLLIGLLSVAVPAMVIVPCTDDVPSAGCEIITVGGNRSGAAEVVNESGVPLSDVTVVEFPDGYAVSTEVTV